MPAQSAISRIPPGHILLHIGPYKTGSTALQSALFARREELATHGVAYPGRWRRPLRPGHALMRWAPRGQKVPPVSVWDDFAADVRALADDRGQRVCLSTEDFGRLRRHERSEKIVTDLGGPERVHVVAVARAYHRLLPSHWQERVKSYETLSYDAWLHEVLEGSDQHRAHRSFWTSHDVERLTSMWLDLIGPDHFTLVVTDDSDRSLLAGAVEVMLGLPEGLLAGDQVANASLSRNAVEVLRRINLEFEGNSWSDGDYRRLVQHGMVRALQAAGWQGEDEGTVPLPPWAQPLLAERSDLRIEAIHSLGVRVVGDVECLRPPEALATSTEEPTTISVDAAATAVAGVIAAALAHADHAGHAGQPRAPGRRPARRKPVGPAAPETSS